MVASLPQGLLLCLLFLWRYDSVFMHSIILLLDLKHALICICFSFCSFITETTSLCTVAASCVGQNSDLNC